MQTIKTWIANSWAWFRGQSDKVQRTVVCLLIGFLIGGVTCRQWRKAVVEQTPDARTTYPGGWRNDPDQVEASVSRMPRPTFADAAANLKGSWDGKTNVCLWQAARKVLGKDIPVQYQTRGTCVSRAASAAVNYVQAVAIAAGEQSDWVDASHAYIYACAKEIMNDVGPANRSEKNDGLTGAAAAEAVTKFGVVSDDQDADKNDSDALAIKWAISGVPADMKAIGKAHPIKTTSRVKSFSEAADALANGYLVVVCSNYGFEPVPAHRDKDGFLKNQGNWGHGMCFIGVVNVNGRRGVVCLNSWGEKWISGPNPLDMPAGCFCIDEATVNGMLGGKMKDSFAYSNFVGFPKRDVDLFIQGPARQRDAIAWHRPTFDFLNPRRRRNGFIETAEPPLAAALVP